MMFQNQVDTNVNRDAYIPNASCTLSAKFKWIGKVMGACIRGKESLVSMVYFTEPFSLKAMGPIVSYHICHLSYLGHMPSYQNRRK